MTLGPLRTACHNAGNLAKHLLFNGEVGKQEAPAAAAPEKDWTVLVYVDGRNQLATSGYDALDKMEHVGSSDRINVVAQATLDPTFRELRRDHMESMPTRRLFIEKDDKTGEVTSKTVGVLEGEHHLSQEDLTDSIKWAAE